MTTIKCLNGLPLEYESFLISKYESYLTTCRYIEIYYPTYIIDFMLVYNENSLIELLIFGTNGSTSKCFNSFASIDPTIISECINIYFENHPSIPMIKVDALSKEYNLKKAILHDKANEYVINLSSTVDEYYLQLGRSTRKSVRNHKSKLIRDYPNVNFITKYGIEIEEKVIDKIIELNIARMKYKGIMPAKDLNEAKRIFRYCKYYGIVTYIEIDNIIVAGDIAYILDKRMFTEVIGHDNDFSAYNLGEVCMFQLIEAAINGGFETLYMSWGYNEYKKRLLAKPHILYSYSIYRTYSLAYILKSINALVVLNITRFRLSKYSMPIRNAIKYYRKRKWSLVLSRN